MVARMHDEGNFVCHQLFYDGVAWAVHQDDVHTTMEYVDFILRRTLDKVRRFPAAGLYRLLAARGEIFRKNDECDQPPTRLPVSCDKSRNDPEYDMPTSNHAPAIVHWWTQVKKDGGLAAVNQSATVSTMLFGCHRWLELHADQSSAEVS